MISVPPPSGRWGGKGKDLPKKSAGELDGCRVPASENDAAQEATRDISENVRNTVWMSLDIGIYSDSEFVFPAPLSQSHCSGITAGAGAARPKPLTMIFASLPQCLNSTSAQNYFVRTECHSSCRDAMVRGLVPLAPLGFCGNMGGGAVFPTETPQTLLSAFFALTQTTPRFSKLSRGMSKASDGIIGRAKSRACNL